MINETETSIFAGANELEGGTQPKWLLSVRLYIYYTHTDNYLNDIDVIGTIIYTNDYARQ